MTRNVATAEGRGYILTPLRGSFRLIPDSSRSNPEACKERKLFVCGMRRPEPSSGHRESLHISGRLDQETRYFRACAIATPEFTTTCSAWTARNSEEMAAPLAVSAAPRPVSLVNAPMIDAGFLLERVF